MSSWELQLVSAIVRDPEKPKLYNTARKSGVETKIFGNAEARSVWSYVDWYYSRPADHGRIPSEMLLKEKFPTLDLPEPVEAFPDLCTLVGDKYTTKKVEQAWEEYLTGVKENPKTALSDLSGALDKIKEQVTAATDRSFDGEAIREVIEDMQARAENDGLVGMPFPWEQFNVELGGLHPGDFAMIYAMPKSMKTWIGLYICVHLAKSGYRTLVYSKEMTWEKVRTRIACILAEIDYTKYRTGTLTPEEQEEVVKALSWFVEECPGTIDFTYAERPDGTAGGPSEIREKVSVYDPEFVLLDSAYLLELPGMKMSSYDWKTMLLMTKELKQIAISCNIPILAIFQESEDKALKSKGTRGTVSLALSKMMIQDVDLAIRCIYNKSAGEMSLQLPAARETTFEGITIYAHACTNFKYAHSKIWEVGDGATADGEKSQKLPEPVTKAVEALGSAVRDNFRQGLPGSETARRLAAGEM